MRLEQLKYIIEIYHTHSLSRAAKNIGLSQPSLSNALAALETEWGVKLFHRLATGVIPTEAGENIIPRISAALSDLQLRLSAVGPQPAPEPTLNIMAVPAASCVLLPDVIADFHRAHPHIAINLLEAGPDILLPTLAENSNFLGINACEEVVEAAYRSEAGSMDFLFDSLYIDHFVCCVPPSSPLADKCALTREDLNAQVLLSFAELFDSAHLAWHESLFPYELFAGPGAVDVDSLDGLKKLVAANVGVTLIPRSALYHDPYLEAGAIVALPFENSRLTFHQHLLLPQKHRLSPWEEDFLLRLHDAYAQLACAFADRPL